MKMKKLMFCLCLIFSLLGPTVAVMAAVPPTESSFFTTDANPEDIKRIAFRVLDYTEGNGDYYREVEGYLLPDGSTLSIDADIYESNLYDEYEHSILEDGFFDEEVMSYSGFYYSESNTITISGEYSVFGCRATDGVRTEWVLCASDAIPSEYYRVLEDGESADSNLKAYHPADTIRLYDAAGRNYYFYGRESMVSPVTFVLEQEGTTVELDGFLVDSSVAFRSSDSIFINKWDWDIYQEIITGETGVHIGNISTSRATATEIVSQMTIDTSRIYSKNSGIWIANENVTDATYRERELKDGEMEVLYAPVAEEFVAPELHEVDDVLSAEALSREYKKVLFKLAQSDGNGAYDEVEGYLFPVDTYIAINRDVFESGNYVPGLHSINEDGTVGYRWGLYFFVNPEGSFKLKTNSYVASQVIHIRVTDPATGEKRDIFLAADTISEECYTLWEEPITTPEPTETPIPEPTATPVPTETPTPEPTAMPIPTETPTPEPTATPVPAETVTPEPTVTPVPAETVAPEPTATPIHAETPTSGPTEPPTVDVLAEDKNKPVAELPWSLENDAAVPIVAVAAVAMAGAFSALGMGLTPALEVSGGVKGRRGQLHINGDVDIPEIHWENIKDIKIPVHISEGEGITWAITAKAFTPGHKELVKTITLPMGIAGAEIQLTLAEDFESKISDEVTLYLEVAALGLDVHGERNFLEKMVEVTISKEKKTEE